MAIGFQSRRHCPLCQSENHNTLLNLPYTNEQLATYIEVFYQGRVPLKRLKSGSYRVLQCQDCEFIFQDQILNQPGMQALYLDWVDHTASLNKKQQAKARLYRQYAMQIQSLARLLPGRPHQACILDYGMGWGYWSRMAQAHGYEVNGYELSTQRCEHARAMGVKVIEQLPEAGEHYDCIYANQVFEHLPDPLDTLQSLCARLKPGGLVYIRVPDGRGLVDWLSNRDWSPELDVIHPFEHINCFTRKSLIAFAAKANLKPVNMPLRLNWGSLWGGVRREIVDRYLTTHVLFRR
jgi:2-polyprenyl-3-methyl-5-hydroxy-6-metoxy-1,4-benzoquinol methylase